MLKLAFIFLTLIEFTQYSFAESTFICQCKATGPGYEVGVNIDKLCSYDCNCKLIAENAPYFSQKNVVLSNLKTSAYSFESWDAGSHICHGQYAFKPNLDSPNWQIQVRFSEFSIIKQGAMRYEQSSEIAYGIRSSIQRSDSAPEIIEALKNALE